MVEGEGEGGRVDPNRGRLAGIPEEEGTAVPLGDGEIANKDHRVKKGHF